MQNSKKVLYLKLPDQAGDKILYWPALAIGAETEMACGVIVAADSAGLAWEVCAEGNAQIIIASVVSRSD